MVWRWLQWASEPFRYRPFETIKRSYPRPVPLEHYIFPAGGEGLHLVVDNRGRFRENNFQVGDLLLILHTLYSKIY